MKRKASSAIKERKTPSQDITTSLNDKKGKGPLHCEEEERKRRARVNACKQTKSLKKLDIEISVGTYTMTRYIQRDTLKIDGR